jgi:hypothetical protein
MSNFNLPLVEDTTVRAVETGTRPRVMTRARKDAPQAAKMAAEILGQRRLGELATVVLDWDDQMGQQHADIIKPIIYMSVSRRFPEIGATGAWLTVESRIDVDNVFLADVMTRSILEDLIDELGEKLSTTALEATR